MKFSTKTIAPTVLLIISLTLIILLWLTTGYNGETDSISHYQYARYAFIHPELFLNHWGKPLFTILAAPLAQFGYKGAIVFNLICGLTSAWFAYLIAKQLKFRHAWVVIVFTIFTPGYIFQMYTSLTEILFSTILIGSICLFTRRKFLWAALVISFIPFVRTEGMMYLIIFIVPLIWLKQYKTLPFLFTGFILFSIAGWSYYHDLLWFFTKMPYNSGGSKLYGSGSFWYYFMQLKYSLDYPLSIMVITGVLAILHNLKRSFTYLKEIRYVTLYFLIIPSVVLYILAQSFLWMEGMMGVLSSPRFIACVLPLVAIIALYGFEFLMQKVKDNKIIYLMLGTFIIFLVAYKPFTYGRLPMSTGINFAVMKETTDWLKTSQYATSRAVYSDPMFSFYMDADPFDEKKYNRYFSFVNIDPATTLKPGELLIWDAQFTGFEGSLPFNSVMQNKNLRLLKVFVPIKRFTIIGGENYTIAVFIKAQKDREGAVYK